MNASAGGYACLGDALPANIPACLAMQHVVQALRLLHGNNAVLPALRAAAEQYHAQRAAPIDELSQLLAHVSIAAAQVGTYTRDSCWLSAHGSILMQAHFGVSFGCLPGIGVHEEDHKLQIGGSSLLCVTRLAYAAQHSTLSFGRQFLHWSGFTQVCCVLCCACRKHRRDSTCSSCRPHSRWALQQCSSHSHSHSQSHRSFPGSRCNSNSHSNSNNSFPNSRCIGRSRLHTNSSSTNIPQVKVPKQPVLQQKPAADQYLRCAQCLE